MRISALKLTCGVAAFALALAFPVSSSAQSSAGCYGFTGRWATTWPGGTTKMRIEGSKGVYFYHGGTLTGHIANGVYWGTYAQSDGNTGTFKFTLSDDGNSFHGWFASSAAPDQHNYWRGICTGPVS